MALLGLRVASKLTLMILHCAAALCGVPVYLLGGLAAAQTYVCCC